jgi:hypothetical protein
VAIVGRPAASALRKEIATPRAGKAVSHAEQVGEKGGKNHGKMLEMLEISGFYM